LYPRKNEKTAVYRNIIKPAVLYRCETWTLIRRGGTHIEDVSEQVLRRIFGPKRDEATGSWRKLHN
jgi:hypothetical protein